MLPTFFLPRVRPGWTRWLVKLNRTNNFDETLCYTFSLWNQALHKIDVTLLSSSSVFSFWRRNTTSYPKLFISFNALTCLPLHVVNALATFYWIYIPPNAQRDTWLTGKGFLLVMPLTWIQVVAFRLICVAATCRLHLSDWLIMTNVKWCTIVLPEAVFLWLCGLPGVPCKWLHTHVLTRGNGKDFWVPSQSNQRSTADYCV